MSKNGSGFGVGGAAGVGVSFRAGSGQAGGAVGVVDGAEWVAGVGGVWSVVDAGGLGWDRFRAAIKC